MVESRLIYAVGEVDYGIIAVADNVASATEAIITSGWVNTGTVIYYRPERKYIPIGDVMEHLGYGDDLNDFVADMLTNRVKDYAWEMFFHTISFYEEV